MKEIATVHVSRLQSVNVMHFLYKTKSNIIFAHTQRGLKESISKELYWGK